MLLHIFHSGATIDEPREHQDYILCIMPEEAHQIPIDGLYPTVLQYYGVHT